MTFAFGVGMFFYNMFCVLIALLIIYYIINRLKLVKIRVENGMENQGFPTICIVKTLIKYLEK